MFTKTWDTEGIQKYFLQVFGGETGDCALVEGIAQASGEIPVSFTYNGERILPESLPSEASVEFQNGYWLAIRTFHGPDGLDLIVETRLYDGVADWTAYLKNTSDEKTGQITDWNVLDLQVRPGITGYVNRLEHQKNSVYRKGDENRPMVSWMKGSRAWMGTDMEEFGTCCQCLRNGDVIDLDGVSCGEFVSPYFEMSWPGGGLVYAIGWTGAWKTRMTNSDDCVHITAGMKRLNTYLNPGETIRSVRIMMAVYQGRSDEGYTRFRRAFIDYIAPRKQDGSLIFPPILTPCPDENRTTGAGELEYISRLKDLEAEVYWLDAWYIRSGYPKGLGNYTFPVGYCVDPKRFPDGIQPLSKAVHEQKKGFLMWFAPEPAPEGGLLQKEYPQYVLHQKGTQGGSLDMTNPEAIEHMVSYLTACIQEYNIQVWRTDSGFQMADVIANEEEGREGLLEIRQVEGLYKLWDRLREENPDLIIDNCCGGGTRLDLELCSRSISVWRTDNSVWLQADGDCVRQPIVSQHLNENLNRYIPFLQNATVTYDPYSVRSGCNGGLTFYPPRQADVRTANFDFDMCNQAFREVKRLRHYWDGDFYRLLVAGTDPMAWCGYQFHKAQEGSGCILVFRRDASPYTEASISAKGIDLDTIYSVDYYYGYEKSKTVCMSGYALKNLTLHLEGAPSSLLLEYRRREDFTHPVGGEIYAGSYCDE